MKEVVEFIKSKCSQEEIAELVKELSIKEETKENDVPKTWEEHVKTLKKGYFIDWDSYIEEVSLSDGIIIGKNVLPTKELAESFLAMMQLMSLRQAWIGDWEPDWNNITANKCCIVIAENSPKIDVYWACHRPLSFPTIKIAENFLNCFRDLIEKAKVLI